MIRFLQTPGPAKKIVLGGLLLVICAAMVITLVPGGIGSDYLTGQPGRGVVAKVAGEEVTTLEVQQGARRLLRQQFPRGTGQESLLLPFFAQQATEQLIREKLMIAEAGSLGLRASDDELRDELQHGQLASVFFPGGNFIGQEAYENLLQQNDLSVTQFEEGVKNDILRRKLAALIAGSVSVSSAEVQREFQRRNTKVKFEYAVLTTADLIKGIHPAEEELKAFYQRNQATYNNAIPEKRKVKYALLDNARLQAQTPVTREDLQAYYDQHRDEFRVPEQVNVRHILVKTPSGPDGKADPKAVEEARKKAEGLLKQLKAGAKFEDLAKKSSDDPGSAKNGGSLGWIGRGRTVPEFEQAAFSLAKGATSDLVKSSYGFHIIRVDDKQTAHLKTLDEVRATIEPVVKQQKSARAAQLQADALLSQARSSTLDKAAAAKGLQVVTTDFVARKDALPGIGASPQFADALFSAREKAPPDLAQLAQGFVVFELLAVKPPATPTFEEIRSRVENEFKNERASVLLAQKTQELSDRAKAAHDLKKAARELGATLRTSELVLPESQAPEIGPMTGPASVAFGMKKGEISGPLNTGSSGAVLSVLEKQEPSADEFARQKDQIRDSLLQRKQGELFGLFLANLRQQMEKAGKIKINEQEMKGLTKGQSEEGE